MAPTSLISRRISSLVRPSRFRVQGWDAPLIISQIVVLQSLFYLTFSLLILLFIKFKEEEGFNLELILNHKLFHEIKAGPLKLIGKTIQEGVVRVNGNSLAYSLAGCWILTQFLQTFYLYHLIRRPTHILDFALTTIFIHLAITSFYTSSLPISFFHYSLVTLSTILQVVGAEQLCVAREMNESFSSSPLPMRTPSEESRRQVAMEMGHSALKVANGHAKSASISRGTYLAVPEEE